MGVYQNFSDEEIATIKALQKKKDKNMGGGSYFGSINDNDLNHWQRHAEQTKREKGHVPRHRVLSKVKSVDFDDETLKQFRYVLAKTYPQNSLIEEALSFNEEDRYARPSMEKALILLFDYAHSRQEELKPSAKLIACTLTRKDYILHEANGDEKPEKEPLNFQERQKRQIAGIVQSLYRLSMDKEKIDIENFNRNNCIAQKILREDKISHLATYYDCYADLTSSFSENGLDLSKKDKKKAKKVMLDGMNAVIKLAL